MLDIKLGQLEVQKDEKASKGAVARTKASHKDKSVSPKPYDQNDDIADLDADEDELVEITPEIYNLEDDDENEGDYAPHFLMEAQYGEESSESFNNSNNGWMNDAFGEDPSKQPELIEVEGVEGQEKKYKCSFCPNKEFKKKPEVMRHFKKHIPLSQRKRFQCEMCREKFISNSNLKTHTKVCTGVAKTYTCKRCKSEFDNKTDYEDHLAEVHNTGRNHECHICHKQLRRAGDVKKHMLTHSEGKPFVCDICGKRFRTESYVKVHKQAHFTNGLTPKKNARKEDVENVIQIDRIEEENDDSILGNGDDELNGDHEINGDANCNGNNDANEHDEMNGEIVIAGHDANEHEEMNGDIMIDGHDANEHDENEHEEMNGDIMIAEHDVKYGMVEDNYIAEPTVERLI